LGGLFVDVATVVPLHQGFLRIRGNTAPGPCLARACKNIQFLFGRGAFGAQLPGTLAPIRFGFGIVLGSVGLLRRLVARFRLRCILVRCVSRCGSGKEGAEDGMSSLVKTFFGLVVAFAPREFARGSANGIAGGCLSGNPVVAGAVNARHREKGRQGGYSKRAEE